MSALPRTVHSRQHPIVNRARARIYFDRAKSCLDFARLRLEDGYAAGAAFWVEQAWAAHRRGRTYQRRLVAQGGVLR